MADAGHDTDGDDWEEASDVFVVRSEVGDSDSSDLDGRSTDAEASTVRSTAPPVAPRRRRVERRTEDSSANADRGHYRDGGHDGGQRGEIPLTPQSVYQLAPLPAPSSKKDARISLTPPVPQRNRPGGSAKPHGDRIFMKPSHFEGKENCIESHLSQFEIISKRNGWDEF